MNNVAPKVKSIVEKACLVVVLLVVLALSSVPVIIYFVNVSLAMPIQYHQYRYMLLAKCACMGSLLAIVKTVKLQLMKY